MYYQYYKSSDKFNAGIYIRLSQEDKDKKYEAESESIKNQRDLLRSYCQMNGYKLVKEYIDDGYTGTNFDRPSFNEMINDIKKGIINLIIVKDLSRLGRDHVMTGYYIETFFPENKVRFISVMESYDSMKVQASNDASTFIIACNDYYSKQNSLKIRSVLDEKRKNGQFIGSKPSYGYMRDPADKGHLIIDEEVAPYVRKIFGWRDRNVGISEIATRLNKMGAPTPSAYKGTSYSTRLIKNNEWTCSTVRKILCNRMYIGDMIQHTQANLNYKSKKKITLDPSLWTIVENTHEPIIDKKVFKRVNDKRKLRNKSTIVQRQRRLLEGLIYCKECGNRLGVTYKKNHNYWTINCNRYARDPIRNMCKPHFFPYEHFEEQVVNVLRSLLNDYINALDIQDLNNKVINSLEKSIVKLPTTNNLKNLNKEQEKIIKKIELLYEDRVSEKISIEQFKILSEPYQKRLDEIKNIIENYDDIKEEPKEKSKITDYTDKILKLLDLGRNRDLLLCIIDRIEVDENRTITIKFKCNFIDDYTFTYEKES